MCFKIIIESSFLHTSNYHIIDNLVIIKSNETHNIFEFDIVNNDHIFENDFLKFTIICAQLLDQLYRR